MRGDRWRRACLGAILLVLPEAARAARIGDIVDLSLAGRAARFFAFEDPSLRYALAGSVLLGACCGLMGAFLVVRKLALMGDALSHAVLPGVALGFLWNMSKDPLAVFVGATLAGLLGAGVVQAIRATTRHKEDAALGFVLASFFGVGICLLTMIQNLPGGSKSGLDKFMFGQAAAMGPGDVGLLAAVAAACGLAVFGLFKEFRLASFDPGFARAIGMRVQFFHYGLMLLLAFAIVASLQAVGVVLVSAMLVVPAAAAFLLADRFGTMLAVSAGFGVVAGAVGCFFSFVGTNLPTGPFMVLAASAIFFAALLFAPRHGILSRVWRHRSRSRRIRRENSLKALYHILETADFQHETVPFHDLATSTRETLEEAASRAADLARAGLASLSGDAAAFTPAGWLRAREIVRNHRLWELYLTNAAHIAPDHVHEDAEKIEHVLGEATVRMLEKRLDYANRDPHGKPIPTVDGPGRAAAARQRATGFGGTE